MSDLCMRKYFSLSFLSCYPHMLISSQPQYISLNIAAGEKGMLLERALHAQFGISSIHDLGRK